MALDADIFNIMFITPLEGTLLYGSFKCILGMQDEWEEIAMYCIRTVSYTNLDVYKRQVQSFEHNVYVELEKCEGLETPPESCLEGDMNPFLGNSYNPENA